MAGSCSNQEALAEDADASNEDTLKDRQLSKELSIDLEPSLLRGVPLSVALSGCGKHWKTPDSGMFHVDSKSYALSRQTPALHTFLSHDWASSRLLKFLSLLIIFNSGAAFWASLGASVLVGVLRAEAALPDEPWTSLLSNFAFLFVLMFWQRLQAPFCRPRMVFLDKLCIAQHDEQLKQKGILGLACFVLSAERLLVLWSPRYFSRLWCTLELATFLKDPENLHRIQFMPLKATGVLVMGTVFWHLTAVGYGFFSVTWQERTAVGLSVVMPVSGVMISVLATALPLVFYVGLSLMRDLEELPGQLAKFRVQDAKCFCCSNNHFHPDTGQPLSCDRRLVFKSLKKWYGRTEGAERTGLDYLDAFNAEVHEHLAPRVVQSMSGGALSFRYTVYMVGACGVPFLSNIIPLCIGQFRAGLRGYALLAWTLRQLMDWGIVSVASVFAVRIAVELWKVGLYLEKHPRCQFFRSRVLLVALLVPCELALVSLCWSSFAYCLATTSETSLLPALPFLLDVLAVLCLFFPRLRGLPEPDPGRLQEQRRPSTRSEESAFEV